MYYYLFIAAFVVGSNGHPAEISVAISPPFADNAACLNAIKAFDTNVPQSAQTPTQLWCQAGASHVPVPILNQPPFPVADCLPGFHHPEIDGVLRTDLCYPN